MFWFRSRNVRCRSETPRTKGPNSGASNRAQGYRGKFLQQVRYLDVAVGLQMCAHDVQLVVIHLPYLVDGLSHLVLPEVARLRLRLSMYQRHHLLHLLQAEGMETVETRQTC